MHPTRSLRYCLISLAFVLLAWSVGLVATARPAAALYANSAHPNVVAAATQARPRTMTQSLVDVPHRAPVQRDRALLILIPVLSGMVAFNLWFARHLHFAYGSPT
jgi:hypothetical protein